MQHEAVVAVGAVVVGQCQEAVWQGRLVYETEVRALVAGLGQLQGTP
jgi:hypothetical protein